MTGAGRHRTQRLVQGIGDRCIPLCLRSGVTAVGLRGGGLWGLRHHETEVAVIDTSRREIAAAEPIPIAAALMAFTVLAHGTPGDVDLMPSRD